MYHYCISVISNTRISIIFFSESLTDEKISAIDLVNDLAESRYPYVSYIEYHCYSEGMTIYLKAEVSLIKKKSLPKDFNFVEVKNADVFDNFSNFSTPSQDDTYQCEILFAAYA